MVSLEKFFSFLKIFVYYISFQIVYKAEFIFKRLIINLIIVRGILAFQLFHFSHQQDNKSSTHK